MLDLGGLGMKKQLQDLFEGIVCAREETDITHPLRWESDDGKTILLLASDKASFSFNLSDKFGLKTLFLVTGALNHSSGDEYELKNPEADYDEGDEAASARAAQVPGMADTIITIPGSAFTAASDNFTLSSANTTVQDFFGAAYKKK
jgi:hypothetical protein